MPWWVDRGMVEGGQVMEGWGGGSGSGVGELSSNHTHPNINCRVNCGILEAPQD